MNAGVILTVGHSTRPIDDFLELLRIHGVERLVDVRTIPRSRHNPQFNRDAIAASLRHGGIAYTHVKSLGGLRHARADSQNLAWRNAGFRGFADYMATPEFEHGLARLLELAARKRCAIMCAEAVPWRCHRSLIADALTARGVPVEHIMSPGKRGVHRLTPFARVRGKRVTYPGKEPQPAQLALEYPPDMAAKKRKPKFTAAKEAKRQAREAIGSPPIGRVIADKRRKPPKHRKSLEEENTV
jgi:hypothetical protein